MSHDCKLEQRQNLGEAAREGGGADRVEVQHKGGKLTARERLELLLDKGSFRETDMFVSHRTHNFGLQERQYLSDSVVTGWGTVDGRLVYVFSQDFSVFVGPLGEVRADNNC